MDEIWKLVYDSFENTAHTGFRAVTGGNATHNEVQFRLQKALSEYKKSPSVDIINAIEADVMLSSTLGFISNEITDKILDILYTIKGE